MPHREWLSAPRKLAISFGLVVLVPAVAVIWLGIRAIADDRDRLTREQQGRREQAAALVADGLARAVDATSRSLRSDASAVVESLDVESLLIRWPEALLEEATIEFEAAEHQEARGRDAASASAAYVELSRSDRVSVRAGALLRLGRVQMRFGQPDSALSTFNDLARLTGARVSQLPADLAARVARCLLLADQRRSTLPKEAEQLRDDLVRLRWPLEPAIWAHYLDLATGWQGSSARPVPEHLHQLARVFWDAFQNLRTGGRTNGRSLNSGFTILWEQTSNEFVGLAASRAFQEREWFNTAVSALKEDGLRSTISSRDGQPGPGTVREASESGLPWTVVIADRDPQTSDDNFNSRRRILLSGLALIVLIAGAGAYFVGRAVNRELAVAQMQSDFVSAVSHEFRTPLTSLRQLTELLNAPNEPDSGKRQTFHRAQLRATERLQRLVESLLDFGRMEAGARPYELKSLSAADFVRELVEEFRKDGLPADFSLELTIAPGTAFIRAERPALARALWNLLDHAVKYSGDSKTIDVVVQPQRRFVEIAVVDRGVGIPVSEHSRIFDKFVRGSAGRDPGIRGTGLGLAMVRHIVHGHHGKVEIVSAPGEGSKFSLLLPVETSNEKAS